MLAKLVVVNTIGAGLLISAHLTGHLGILLSHDHLYVIPIMCLIGAVGLYNAFRGRWGRVMWLADQMPLVGLIATGIAVQFVGGEGEALATNLRHALVGMITGVAWLLWLEFLAWCCNEEE
jgi:hypothetical protein